MPRTPGSTERSALERIVEIIPRLSRRQLYAMETYISGVRALREVMTVEGEENILEAVDDYPELEREQLKAALKADAEDLTEAQLDDVVKIMELVPRLTKNEANALLVYVDGVAGMKKALSSREPGPPEPRHRLLR